MATIQTEASNRPYAPRNTRTNEVIAVGLFSCGLLLLLCLIPVYSYSPDDRSWNAAGQTGPVHNLIGAVGANVAAALFQPFGLAALLFPLLILLAAWRRFRTRRMHAPVGRVLGLIILIMGASALLDLARIPLPFDGGFLAGGFLGNLLSTLCKTALNPVGTGILLACFTAIGVLLATNFSFAYAFDRTVHGLDLSRRLSFLGSLATRFRLWQVRRRQQAQEKREKLRAAREERLRIRKLEGADRDKTLAERAADFMRETDAEKSKPFSPPEPAATTKLASASPTAPPAAMNQAVASPTSALSTPIEIKSYGDPAAPALQTPKMEDPGDLADSSAQYLGDDLPYYPGTQDHAALEMVASVTPVGAEVQSRVEVGSTIQESGRSLRRAAKAVALAQYLMPDVDLLKAPAPRLQQADDELRGLATRVTEKCREFNVTGKIEFICPGPVVTTYEFKPDPGVKYSRVTGLVDDLCLGLKAESIRIDRVPGKAHVGIEVPNPSRETIFLREVLESRQFRDATSKLTIALGKTIDGLNYVADLARMPHLLIAGATGAGKSVCLNTLVISVLFKAPPDEVKFIMIDPKRLELGLYADIPHLATPIITDPKRAANALKWAVSEMERRYKQMAKFGVRNIDGFNTELMRRNLVEEFDETGSPWSHLPYIVIIIDELADLMMVSGHEVEESITRLAQMARAVGIHLVLATQRPSVDVITGLIKANFPSRIAFRVSSKVDSRTIIDCNGAEQLLGRGDMLFLPPGSSRLVRVHGAFVDETEVARIVAHVNSQGSPVYNEAITLSEEENELAEGNEGERDELFQEALRICVEMKRASTSVLQRRLRIGYGRAAAILDAMQREGYIGPADGARPRPISGRAYETVEIWDRAEQDHA